MRHLEVKLQEELLRIIVPVSPELVLPLVNFSTGNLESNGLIRLASNEQILPCFIWRFDSLFVGRHEAMFRLSLRNLRVVDLKQQAMLSIFRISLFCYFVSRSSNLHKLLNAHLRFFRGWLNRSFFRFLGCSASKVLLMLLSLSVSKITPLVIMQRQTQLAFIRTQMVLHEIRILVQIDSFEGELSKSLASITIRLRVGSHTSAPRLPARAVLEVHGVN